MAECGDTVSKLPGHADS